MAVTIVKTQMDDQSTNEVVTTNAATSSVIDATEAFTVAPTAPGFQTLMIVKVAASHGAVAYSIAKGSGPFAAGAAETGSFAENTVTARVIDSGRFKNASGNIVITFTPASGKRLLTDHALTVQYIQMPF